MSAFKPEISALAERSAARRLVIVFVFLALVLVELPVFGQFPERLVLADGKEVSVTWRDPRSGGRGAGHGRLLTADTGAYWFFAPDNLEIVVKALDAGSVNGHGWVFVTALTDVEWTVRVHEPHSLLERLYIRPAGAGGPVQDTGAFPEAWLAGDVRGERWLWIGAHPDDEVLAAPWLEEACRQWGADCTFLVVTHGEAGSCLAPQGCSGDLATLRSREMAASADFYGAELVLWSWPDGAGGQPSAVEAAWNEVSGDEGAVAALVNFLRSRQPDRVVTLDPRHGSTCHPDHRALGSLVSRAVSRLIPGPELQVVASRAVFEEGLPAGFVAAAPVGAERRLAVPASGRSEQEDRRWQALLDTVSLHASQFPASWLSALAEAEPDRRRVELRTVTGVEPSTPSCPQPAK